MLGFRQIVAFRSAKERAAAIDNVLSKVRKLPEAAFAWRD
jgi:hypothetical protein